MRAIRPGNALPDTCRSLDHVERDQRPTIIQRLIHSRDIGLAVE
ncbi:MAG: hypothetical protein U0231_04590 [Nitrospiraceae bacterium]